MTAGPPDDRGPPDAPGPPDDRGRPDYPLALPMIGVVPINPGLS